MDTAVDRDDLRWAVDGVDWPHRAFSRFVDAGGLRWHLQDFPGPPGCDPSAPLLLLHGTGSSAHSWRSLAPLLAHRRRILAPDLPGHGFTAPAGRLPVSPAGMARAVAALAQAIGVRPWRVVGHSAGAAIAVRWALDGGLDADTAPGGVVSLNGALVPMSGAAWTWFAPAAKLFAAAPIVPWLFARRARDPGVVDRLLAGTGSRVDAPDRRIYQRLVRSPAHVAGALQMMAQWDLASLQRDLPGLQRPGSARLHLLVGDRDRLVPPQQARQVQVLVPSASCQVLPGLGHLAHEEAPQAVLAAIEACAGA